MKLGRKELLRSRCYVNGKWIDGDQGDRIAVADPATGAVIGSVPLLGKKETCGAIEAAHRAWPAWRRMTAKERARLLRRWHDLLVAHHRDLAVIMTMEQGKPLADAQEEILHGAGYIEWYAEEGKRVYGETIPMGQMEKRIIVLKEPMGVCAAITPWNFPSAMIARKAAPALAAGCPVVVKPASRTPLSALALAALADEAGFPPGVFNVVTGSASAIGAEMTANPLVRKLSFTGSTAVGKLLMRDCAATVKRVSLELGGHAPFIVFDDADLDAAVRGAVEAKYRNSGQTCVCANRFLIHERVYERFTAGLVEAVRALKVGNGFEAGIQQGPLIDLDAIHKVEEQIADAVAKGAHIACGGRRLGDTGFFFEPTVLLGGTTSMQIARDETFGPVAPLFVFRDDNEAIALANDTPYGLAAYFYSRDIGRIWRTAEALEYGMVGVNTGRMSSEAAPFGGVKESGIGREGSKYGIEEYLELKYLCLGGLGQRL
jgi:succinate-semialdehyde dehydrogenase